MFAKLKQHLFPVQAHFDYSLVLTYAFNPAVLRPLVPDILELDTFEDRWTFAAVAMVQTRGLRPLGFPAVLGSDFFLIGYRIFVRYRSSSGQKLRGLYILKSETDKLRMRLLGNLFTSYQYSRIDAEHGRDDDEVRVRSRKGRLQVRVRHGGDPKVSLPPGSPFADWRQARLFSGPLPFTFSVDQQRGQVVIVEGVRESWSPRPVAVLLHEVEFLEKLGPEPPRLANAFITESIPYQWRRGRVEPFSP